MTTPTIPSVIEAGKALLARADNHAREIAEPLFLEEREALRAALATPSPVEEGLLRDAMPLVLALRDRADCAEDACRADGDNEVYQAGFDQLRKAADTIEALAGVLGLRDGP